MPAGYPPIMPLMALLLFLLPFRLSAAHLKILAFWLWLIGGLVLTLRGLTFLQGAVPFTPMWLMAIALVAALTIGWAKGRFVLSKTARKNKERLDAFTTPQRPLKVYSGRSWLIITLMVVISVALNVLAISGLVRGAVNLGIGTALIISSLAYIRTSKTQVLPVASAKFKYF